jgi:hypothetical protein
MLTEGTMATASLPGGVFTEDGRLLRDVELRPLTGGEEDWLARSASAPAAHAVSRVLSHCIVRVGDAPGDARAMLVGDRDFLMLQLRRMTLGSHVQAVIACPECAAKMDLDFDLDDIAIDAPAHLAAVYEIESDRRSIHFRLPVGADQEAVTALPVADAVDALLARCIVDDGGKALSADERAAVISAMEAAAPRVEPELDLTCPECAHAFTLPIGMTSFFLDEMRVRSDQLLREIHALAFYYHWTEGEILRLTRDRRRAYLSLLSDALRGE